MLILFETVSPLLQEKQALCLILTVEFDRVRYKILHERVNSAFSCPK